MQKAMSTRQSTLQRVVNNNTRYYKLLIYLTLFNEYLLIIEYGGMKNKNPTRTIKEYFTTVEELRVKLNIIIQKKLKKGYKYI